MSFFQKIDTIYLFFVRKEWTNLVEHMKAGTSWWIEGKINADHFKNINLIVSFNLLKFFREIILYFYSYFINSLNPFVLILHPPQRKIGS